MSMFTQRFLKTCMSSIRHSKDAMYNKNIITLRYLSVAHTARNLILRSRVSYP